MENSAKRITIPSPDLFVNKVVNYAEIESSLHVLD